MYQAGRAPTHVLAQVQKHRQALRSHTIETTAVRSSRRAVVLRPGGLFQGSGTVIYTQWQQQELSGFENQLDAG